MAATNTNPSEVGTVFLTGGTGKIASRIAALCAAAGIPHIIASRSAPPTSSHPLNPPPPSSSSSSSSAAQQHPLSTHARFDWSDSSTWAPALSRLPFPGAPPVRTIFLVTPGMSDPAPVVEEFLGEVAAAAAAHSSRSSRPGDLPHVVLLSSSLVPEGGPAMGQIHALLRRLATPPQEGEGGGGDEKKKMMTVVGSWAVLRPSWFQENFADAGGSHVRSLRGEDQGDDDGDDDGEKDGGGAAAAAAAATTDDTDVPDGSKSRIYSATGSGRVPWVSASDIAAVGFYALTHRDPHPGMMMMTTNITTTTATTANNNNEYLILGPQLLSYDDIAGIFARELGHPVRHVKLNVAQLARRHERVLGLSPEYAGVLAGLDGLIERGEEDRLDFHFPGGDNDDDEGESDEKKKEERKKSLVELVTGRRGRTFEEFVEENRGVWG